MSTSAASRTIDFRDTALPEREANVLRAGITVLRDRLPTSWKMQVEEEAKFGDRRLDAIVRLTTPDGQQLALVIEAKRLINTRDVPIVLEQTQGVAGGWEESEQTIVVLAARYLSPATRERIAAAGASYVDATGNIRLVAERPALFLSDRGADRDPWRGRGRPRGTLRGEPAARIVRALIDFTPPYSVPDLAKRAGASTGATYRVVELLEQEDLLTRELRGPITDVRWRPLLMRWSEDYGFVQSNFVRTYLEPRGLTALTEQLRELDEMKYVLTGSLAAERVAPYAPARLAMLYVDDPDGVKQALGLREMQSGTNVALASAEYKVVFDRSEMVDGLRVAALSQVVVDLLSGPGRNPSEATALLDWMQANEPSWRR